MTRTTAIPIGIVVLAAAIGIPFWSHHLGYEKGLRHGYQGGLRDEKELLKSQMQATKKAEAKPAVQHQCFIRVTVAKGDTFSDLTHDLYGNGDHAAYEVAAREVKGLPDPSNPNLIVIGQILVFPAMLTVEDKKLCASYPAAARRWRTRHERKDDSDPSALFLTVPALPEPGIHADFPEIQAPTLAALADPGLELPAAITISQTQLARPDPLRSQKRIHTHRRRHAVVLAFMRVGHIGLNGLMWTGLTGGNPIAGFGIAGGQATASFLIARHERKLERSLKQPW